MSVVEIYGASDDLIEIEGDIEEEFYYKEGERNLLAFSNGSVLEIEYTPQGMWRVTPIKLGNASGYSKVEATDEHTDYSDRVTLIGDVDWVVHGSGYGKRGDTLV